MKRCLTRRVNKSSCAGHSHGEARNREPKGVRESYVKEFYAKVLKEGMGHVDTKSLIKKETIKDNQCGDEVEKFKTISLEFRTYNDEEWKSLQKAYVGVVINPRYIQNSFHAEGYFSIKVTPLGPNLCFLEGQEDGGYKSIGGGKYRLVEAMVQEYQNMGTM